MTIKQALAAITLIVAVVTVYSPALRAPFEFDDLASIPGNASIRRLWPPSIPLSPPPNTTVAGRPVVNYSLALSYAINERLGVDQRLDPFGSNKTVGYRLLNIFLHLGSGLLLFGILRRTLRRLPIGQPGAGHSIDAVRIAGIVTALWLVHPIQSEAVNYVVQRTELLVSACYLGTIYGSLRAWDSVTPRARTAWRVFAVVVCLLGMGSKEVMVTAPLMVVLYDRAFRLASWKEVVSDHGRLLFYLSLAATSAWTIALMAGNARAGTVGFGAGMPWYRYTYSQAWAILHYLRLAIWPDQLTFDYGQRPVTGPVGIPGAIVLTVLLAATIVAWIRLGRWAGFAFLGAWFFLLLAPSSSVVPIATEIAAERRIYLALAAAITLAVVVAWKAARRWNVERWFTAGWVGVAALLAATTFMRSKTYADAEALWRDTVRKAPTNPRAYNNLASTLFFTRPPRLAEAQELYYKAIALDSTYLPPWSGLASIAVNEGRLEDAKWLLEQALRVDPEYADGVEQIARLYLRMGQPGRAIPYLERLTKAYPTDNALVMLASAYMQTGRLDAAALTFENALDLNPDRADALLNLGGLLVEQGRGARAIPILERATTLEPNNAIALALASVAYAEAGRRGDAARTAALAVARAGDNASVHLLAGRAMLVAAQLNEAERYLAEAIRLEPSNPEALTRLGIVKRALGNDAEARRLFRRALEVDSGYAPAKAELRK